MLLQILKSLVFLQLIFSVFMFICIIKRQKNFKRIYNQTSSQYFQLAGFFSVVACAVFFFIFYNVSFYANSQARQVIILLRFFENISWIAFWFEVYHVSRKDSFSSKFIFSFSNFITYTPLFLLPLFLGPIDPTLYKNLPLIAGFFTYYPSLNKFFTIMFSINIFSMIFILWLVRYESTLKLQKFLFLILIVYTMVVSSLAPQNMFCPYLITFFRIILCSSFYISYIIWIYKMEKRILK